VSPHHAPSFQSSLRNKEDRTLAEEQHEEDMDNAVIQAEGNTDTENDISNSIEEEQRFEDENGGGVLTEEGHEEGHSEEEEVNTQLDPNVPTEDLAEEDEFMSNSEIQTENEEEANEDKEEDYVITLKHHDQLARLKNFRRISQDLKGFENEYRTCLQTIPSLIWSEVEIEKCVGPEFTQIVNDINYEKARIKDAAAIALREVVIKECYEKAGMNEIQSDSCDHFEKDLIQLMWNQYDFYKLLIYNRDKYIFVYGRMPAEIFDAMILKIKPINDDISAFVDEIEAHRDLIVVKIKQYVDDRTKAIVNLANYNKRVGVEKVKSFDVHIVKTVKDDGIEVNHLPSHMRQDPNVFNVFNESSTPKVDEIIEHMKGQSIKNLYEGSKNIEFDDGKEGEPREHNVNQMEREDSVPLVRKLGKKSKADEIRKLELKKVERQMMAGKRFRHVNHEKLV
jgi:hypothetical protein